MRIGLLPLIALMMAAGQATADETTCCFANPAYSGLCQVTPAKDETCQSILQYLNNPSSSGKSYCGGTDLRGGWSLASCTPSARAETAPAEAKPPRPAERRSSPAAPAR